MSAILSGPLCVSREDRISYQDWETEWRIYESVNYATIGSNNGLSPVRRQAIIGTNDGSSSIRA